VTLSIFAILVLYLQRKGQRASRDSITSQRSQ